MKVSENIRQQNHTHTSTTNSSGILLVTEYNKYLSNIFKKRCLKIRARKMTKND